MTKNIFITGTDTGIGKTTVSVALLKSFNAEGKSTLGIKPIASGCYEKDGILVSDDALALQEASSLKLDYDIINPIRYEEPIAPAIAAEKTNSLLNLSILRKKCAPALKEKVDVRIIEGVGGWLQPLNTTENLTDFVIAENFSVIFVVGMRLGCINQALLVAQSLQSYPVNVLGWIANCIDPDMLVLEENIVLLQELLPYPCLDILKFNPEI